MKIPGRVFVCSAFAFLSLLLECGSAANAQSFPFVPANDAPRSLIGLAGVSPFIAWARGAPDDTEAIRTDVELKLRQAGVRILTPDELGPAGGPLLVVSISRVGPATLVSVQLFQFVFSQRDVEEYFQRMIATDGHATGMYRTSGVVWQRFGIAQNALTETVQQIVERYKKASAPWVPTQAEQHMMELEIQVATANAQSAASLSVREIVKNYVDAFLNDYLAANPKQR